MLKKLLWLLLCLGPGCIVYAQQHCVQPDPHRFDTLLARTIERNISHPFADNGAEAGVNLPKVFKRASTLVVLSVYTSDERFNAINYAGISKALNEKFNELVQSPYSIIIPLYFYHADTQLTESGLQAVKSRLRKLAKRRNIIISNKPVNVVELDVVR